MLIVTNVAAVEAVIAHKAPRPMRDVILEIYPNATIDVNGRAHAPYDGYECQLTGRTFAAGEFLPMSEPDDNYRIVGGHISLPTAVDLDGTIHEWDCLTRAQRAAVYAELIAQTREHDAVKSRHVGNVGDKVTLAAIVEMVKGYDGMYGTVWFHVLKDLTGNVLVYKGSKRLADKGANITLAAKIKSHGDREGVKQTLIERPRLV